MIISRNVKIIRLVGRSTVEEIILRRAEDKLQLTNAVMSSGSSSASDDLYKVKRYKIVLLGTNFIPHGSLQIIEWFAYFLSNRTLLLNVNGLKMYSICRSVESVLWLHPEVI